MSQPVETGVLTPPTKTPQRCRFEFALWTSNRLRQALYQEFGVQVSVWTVRRILNTVGLTPQRSKRRATKYNPGDVQQRKEQELPRITKRAKELGSAIVFADESGLSSQCVYGRTWGVAGETPVVKAANNRFLLNIFVAMSREGEMYYMIREGRGKADIFCRFIENIMENIARKIQVIVDTFSIHTAKETKKMVAEHEGEYEIHYLPAYSPQLNPVELTWSLIKREVSQQVSQAKAQMLANLTAAFQSLKRSPERVQAFFHERNCKYILA